MKIYTNRPVLAAGLLLTIPLVAGAGDKLTEPVDVYVTNPVVQVEVSNADPMPVSVANLPQPSSIPFARECEVVGETCSIDLTDLMEMGEVHITQASGQALNVGVTASPRFFNGAFGGPEVLLPAIVNSLDTGSDRDIAFSQSMDLIPMGLYIEFIEPDSTNVYFYLHGHVVGLGAASAASATNCPAAGDAGLTGEVGKQSP